MARCTTSTSRTVLVSRIASQELEAGLIRGNVLEVINSVPVVMGSNKPLHFSGNMKWSGVTVRPQTGTDGIDLETKIQDALMLSL